MTDANETLAMAVTSWLHDNQGSQPLGVDLLCEALEVTGIALVRDVVWADTRTALRQLLETVRYSERHCDYGDGTCIECGRKFPCAIERARVLVSDAPTPAKEDA